MPDMNYVFTHIPSGKITKEIVTEWAKLTDKIQQRAFYHEPQWFHAYIACQSDTEQSCHFFQLAEGERLLAIFPLKYTLTKRFGIPLRTWQICWPNDMGVNDFVIPESLHRNEILVKFIDHLRAERHRYPWDLLELQNVPEQASISSLLKNQPIPQCISVYHHNSKYLVCGQDYDASVANVSGKFKKNNRRKLRNLEKLGSVTTTYIDEPEELYTAFEQFLDVEAANWKGQEGTALRHDTSQLRFYRTLLDEYATTGRCAIHIMKLDNVPIAAQFALISGDTYYLLKIGYNAEYHSMGPGGLLLDETIRHFSGHPVIKHISFITGAKWNDDWAPQAHKVYHHYIYNKTFKGLICKLTENLKAALRDIKHKLNK